MYEHTSRGFSMEITISDFGDLGKRVTLVGRLDIVGAAKIDLPLKELADSRTNIVVDMSEVDFIGSLGMRSLVVAAKTLVRNARTLILLNPTPLVADALTKAGLHTLLPMVQSESEAQVALSRPRIWGTSQGEKVLMSRVAPLIMWFVSILIAVGIVIFGAKILLAVWESW
jgi:anti-anti-sigma factor